jgi:long-chain acyl-CoA synthetase
METLTPTAVTSAEVKLPTLLGELAEFNLKRFGEYTYLHFEGRDYKNTEIADQARRLAGGLLSLGVKAGDRVVVMMLNSPDVYVAFQAIARISAVVVPLLPVLKTPEVQHIAGNCQPTAFITNLPLTNVIKPALEAVGLAGTTEIIALGDSSEVEAAGYTSYTKLIEDSEPYTAAPTGNPDDLAVIIYTSGTTGKPKGVMQSHNNQLRNILSGLSEDYLLGRTTREPLPGLTALPMAHAMGLTGSNASYMSGDLIVLLPRFEPQKVYEAIERFRIKRFGAVPAMVIALYNFPDIAKYDTSSLQMIGCGSAPLPESVLLGIQQRLGITLREGYGLTEATTAVATSREEFPIRHGSVGKPLAGVEVKIVDHAGNELAQGERGEIIVRGHNVMMGYYGNPEATAEAIKNGWLYSGDVGYFDEEGYLYIVERKKDLIIRNGQNIYPRDVEEVIAQHPAVREVAVVGVPSEKTGEEVKAYIALQPDQEVSAEAIIAYTQQFMANYKTPSQVEFIEALPRNTVGKINKRALRELAAVTVIPQGREA